MTAKSKPRKPATVGKRRAESAEKPFKEVVKFCYIEADEYGAKLIQMEYEDHIDTQLILEGDDWIDGEKVKVTVERVSHAKA